MPNDARVLKYTDSFVLKPTKLIGTQGGYWIILRVDSGAMRALLHEADRIGYHKVGDDDPDSALINERGFRASFPGRYLLKPGQTTHQNEQFVLLDSSKLEITVTRSRISNTG